MPGFANSCLLGPPVEIGLVNRVSRHVVQLNRDGSLNSRGEIGDKIGDMSALRCDFTYMQTQW